MDTARASAPAAQILVYVLAAGLLSSTGNLIIKGAIKAMGGLNLGGGNLVATLVHLFTNPGIVIGLALYLVGFVLWARVLSMTDISTAYPIFISLAFIVVVVGSRILFGESLGMLKVLGIVIIALGIFVVSRG